MVKMNTRRPFLAAFVFFFLPAVFIWGPGYHPPPPEAVAGLTGTIALEIPAGTPLPVVLGKEVRIRKAGQPIHGTIADPIYAFDKLVVPAGSEVTGSVTRIAGVSKLKRTMAALDANFSPTREIEVTFDQLVLPDGSRIPLRTQVSPTSQGVLQFATATKANNQTQQRGKNAARNFASRKIGEAKQQINLDWNMAKAKITAPGKVHRLKRLAIAQFPFHPQYFDAGTRFNAELLEPLNFGTEELTAEKVQMVGTTPAPGSVIHARLKTPLSSASTQKGAPVEAVMTEPLFTDNRLVLPEGTVLKGSVLQVQPARRLHRNGQLRIVFHEIVPPKSPEQHVAANLEGVEVKDDQHLSLDSEGGAQATTPKTRYLTTGISLALVTASFWPDRDPNSARSLPELATQATNGASGFHVVGFILGALISSRDLASGFGAYGAAMSIYDNFLTRGGEVSYPKDTTMAISFGSRVTTVSKAVPQT